MIEPISCLKNLRSSDRRNFGKATVDMYFGQATVHNTINISTLSKYGTAVLRIRDVYPGSRILIFTHPGSRILDPRSRIQKTATKDRGEKFFFVKPFFVDTNFTKLNIILFLMCWRKKFGPRIIEVFYPKNYNQALKKMSLGSRIQGSKRHRIPDPDPQHCGTVRLFFNVSIHTIFFIFEMPKCFCIWRWS